MQEQETRAAEQRVLDYCREEGLFPALPGQSLRVAAAVSGGADSMALLRLLHRLAPQLGIELSACHIHHGLRGASADRDEAFVREACAALGVPLRVFHAAERGPIPPHAGEDWARRLRYACFEELCAEGIDRVATAHTASDQAETLLFRLARGTGLHGAGGIRPSREMYVRPLLRFSRADTERYCAALGQPYVTDETNLGDAYARNRLRHHALPALVSVNEAAEKNLAAFCERAARADEYFTRQAAQLLREAADAARQQGRSRAAPAYALSVLRAADPLILSWAAHGLVAPVRDPEEKYIRLTLALVENGSGAVQLTDRVRLCAGAGCLWQENSSPAPPEETAFSAVPFAPETQREYRLAGGRRLECRLSHGIFLQKTQAVHKKDLKNRADYDRIRLSHSALLLRSRLPGDTFRPAGRGVRKKLRRWMNEAAIPAEQRDTLPLLADGNEVLWIYGIGFADGLSPDAESRTVLEMITPAAEEE